MARYSKGKYHVLLNEYTYENGHGFDYHLKLNRDFLIVLEGGDNSSKYPIPEDESELQETIKYIKEKISKLEYGKEQQPRNNKIYRKILAKLTPEEKEILLWGHGI